MKQVTPKMVYTRWVAALRSGEYRQATGQLRECEYGEYDYENDVPVINQVVGFCCLGVLQDLAVKDGGDDWNSRGGSCDDDAEPKKQILNFMGLDNEMTARLVEMNDDEGADFNEIADTIEDTIMPSLGY